MRFYVYPADDLIGGTIEPREIVHWSEKVASFDQRDKYGRLGAKIFTVFPTLRQAIDARAYQIILLDQQGL